MNKRLKTLLRPLANDRTLHLYHWLRAAIANICFGFPSRGMLVIGVTGTKGKTTTCHFLASILQEAGFKVGMATTVNFRIGDLEEVNNTNMSVTAPWPLQRLLRRMKNARCDAVVVEVTSIALDQYRTLGIPFAYAGLTNITHDHLDYHKTWANYQAAKLKLFLPRRLRMIAVNLDDPSAKLFLERTPARERWGYGLSEGHQPAMTQGLYARDFSDSPDGASFTLAIDEQRQPVRLRLPGAFSVENALCAASICLSLGVSIQGVARGLERLERVAGRLEKISASNGVTVLVDYAHTPDSLEKLYSTLRGSTAGRMIAVLGATGDRDRTKRPIMGALAARFCDFVFVTDEEPYAEDPLAIIEEVAAGVPRGRALFAAAKRGVPKSKAKDPDGLGEWWFKVADRKQAIEQAISKADSGDLVLVTGMGAQNFRKVGDRREPWNDRQVVESIFSERGLL